MPTQASHFGVMDDMTYSYTGNQLKAVDDDIAASATQGFVDGGELATEYTYDLNGNVLTDANKGIIGMEYNHFNLPILADFGSGNKIEYFYDALGNKLKKKVTDITNGNKESDYSGNYIYEGGKLQFFAHSEGYVEPKNPDNLSMGYNYTYQYKDHLGNIRLSYKNVGTSTDPDLEIQEESNYYPFGLKHKGYNVVLNGREHKYKYNNKELEEDLGKDTYAYGWRDYDPALGRFNKLDRFAEKYQNLSPYSYAANNPIRLVDVQGDSISGVSRKDARRARRIIRKTFKGSKNRKIRKLFRTKGTKFQEISEERLANATEGANQSAKDLASAYAKAINSDFDHKVEVVKRGDGLSKFSQTKTALKLLGRTTANDVERLDGGGVNAPLYKNGNLTVLVMDSKTPVPLLDSSNNSIAPLINIQSTMAHELLGHGVGSVLESSGYEHVEAIQMENMALRAQGLGRYQNNGSSHGPKVVLPLNVYSGVPTHFQQ